MPVDPRLSRLEASAREPSQHPELLDALEHPEVAMRRQAIALAARHLAPEAMLPLLRDGANATRRNGARAVLRRQTPASFEVARHLLEDADPDVVIIAIEVLSEDPRHETFEFVRGLVDHQDTNVAVAAIEALGHFESGLALPPLLRALSAETWRKLAAISAIGTMGDPEAVGPLLGCLADMRYREPCLGALENMASERAFDAVAELASETEGERGFARAIRTLCSILERLSSPEAACEILQRRLKGAAQGRLGALTVKDDPETRRAALALGALLQPQEWLERAVADRTVLKMAGGVRASLSGLAERHCGLLLASSDATCRAAALELAPTAPRVHKLLALLRDPDAGVRAGACTVLAERRHLEAAPALVEVLLAAAAGQERERVTAALRELGEGAARAFDAALARARSDDQLAALLACAPLSSLSAIRGEDLRSWSRAAHTGLRLQVVGAAARLTTPLAERIVLDAMTDSDPHVSAQAAQALARKGLVTDVLQALERPSFARFRLISALSQPGLHAVVPSLIALYSVAAPHERVEIVATLGRIGGSAVVEFLGQRARDSEPAVRRAAAEALATRALLADEDSLMVFSRDVEWSVRRWAVEGLSRLRTHRAQAALADLARDVDDGVAQAARRTLRATGVLCP